MIETAPRHAEALRKLGLDTLDGVMGFDGGTMVSPGRSVTTVRVDADDGAAYYLKRAPRCSGRHASRMINEAHVSRRLRDQSVNTYEVVAFGRRRTGIFRHDAFIVTRGIEGARSLLDVASSIDPDDPTAPFDRRDVLHRLGQLVRGLHNRGFVHGDLFMRNVLFDGTTLHVIDYPRGRFVSGGVDDTSNAAVGDLACLGRDVPAWLSVTDRLRVVRGYLGRRIRRSDRSLIQRIVKEMTALVRRIRRQLKGHKRFFRVNPPWDAPLREANLNTFNAITKVDSDDYLSSHTSRWVRRFEAGGRTFILKQQARGKLKHYLGNLIHGRLPMSKNSREFFELERFRVLGLPSTDWAAVGERRCLGYDLESFLLAPTFRRHRELTDLLDQHRGDPSTRRRLIAACARLVGRMHGLGLMHCDLYAKHLWLAETDENWQAAMIDLQRVVHFRQGRFRPVVRDLATLNASTRHDLASPAERLRFLKDYIRRRRLNVELKRLARKVVAASHALGKRKDCRAWRTTETT